MVHLLRTSLTLRSQWARFLNSTFNNRRLVSNRKPGLWISTLIIPPDSLKHLPKILLLYRLFRFQVFSHQVRSKYRHSSNLMQVKLLPSHQRNQMLSKQLSTSKTFQALEGLKMLHFQSLELILSNKQVEQISSSNLTTNLLLYLLLISPKCSLKLN